MQGRLLTSLLIWIVALTGYGQNIPYYVPQNGLIGWWPFNGNANDLSPNMNNGQISNVTPAPDRFGIPESSYDFNGINSFIRCIKPGPTGNPTVTASFWIKTIASLDAKLISYGSDGGSGESYRIGFSNSSAGGLIGFDTWDNAKIFCFPYSELWNHYVVIYDGTKGTNTLVSKIYKNGNLLLDVCQAVNISPTKISDIFPINFGRYHGTLQTSYYKGLMDDVGLWHRMLTEKEILELYNAPAPNSISKNILLSSNTVEENLNIGAPVGDLIGTIGDQTGDFSYTLVSGTGSEDNAFFSITDNTLKTASIFNSQVKSNYKIRIRATESGGLFFEKNFIINVLPSYLPTAGLLGWWPFNGNANDESGNNNEGTINGATLVNDRFGNTNSAYAFNGTNSYIVCKKPGPIGNPSVSVSFWLNTEQTTFANLVGYGSEAQGTGGNFRTFINEGERLSFCTESNEESFCTKFQSTWDHYVVIYDGSSGNNIQNTKIYRNGCLLQKVCFTVQTGPTNIQYQFPITFGRFHGISQDGYLDGLMDDIAIWDRSLTEKEIFNLFKNTSTSSPFSLTATIFNENLAKGSEVGTINNINKDDPALTYSFANGEGDTDNSAFTIVGNKLNTATVFNTSIKSSYSVRIKGINSQGLSFEKIFILNVLPVGLQTKDLIGWWPFNGNADDESGNRNNGIVNGATLTSDRFGKTSSAYFFNGTSSFIQCKKPGPTGNPIVSVSFWLKTKQSNYGHLIGYGGPGLNAWGGSFRLFISGSESKIAFDTFESQQAFCTTFSDVWDHYVMVYDGSLGSNTLITKVFKNGKLLTNICYSIVKAPTNIYDFFPIIFGRDLDDYESGDYLYFNGTMDDIAIWNRALSEIEIQSLYKNQIVSSQQIVLSPLPPLKYGDEDIKLSAIASSGLQVQFSSSDSDVAEVVNNNTLKIRGAGTAILTLTQNGDFTWLPATTDQKISVSKASLTVLAENKSKIYYDPNPTLTIKYNGFKNKDTELVLDNAPSISTTATRESNSGIYSITTSGGFDNNYSFIHNSGELFIQKSKLIVFAENKSRIYGEENPQLTIYYEGFKNNESPSVLNTSPIATTSALPTTPAGNYAIDISGGEDNNYLF